MLKSAALTLGFVAIVLANACVATDDTDHTNDTIDTVDRSSEQVQLECFAQADVAAFAGCNFESFCQCMSQCSSDPFTKVLCTFACDQQAGTGCI